MIAFAYLLPLITCIILKFGFQFEGEWKYYCWIIVVGETVVGALQSLFYFISTSDKEYIGSLVQQIQHEESWTELLSQTVTRRDLQGNTYTTSEIRQKVHPEKFYFQTSRGSTINTTAYFFDYVLETWKVVPDSISWQGRHIKGGIRYGTKASMPMSMSMSMMSSDDPRWVSVTEKHIYKNRIKNSNSILKYRYISKEAAEEMRLFHYPEIDHLHDTDCILVRDVQIDEACRNMFRRFNGKYASNVQMRLFILVFPASIGVGISELQRAYWQGGHKNEFTICIGLSPNSKVKWARVFSWTDDQRIETETANWFLQHPDIDWKAFYHWFIRESAGWKRKAFSDFKYINISLPLWQVFTIYTVSVFENIMALILALR